MVQAPGVRNARDMTFPQAQKSQAPSRDRQTQVGREGGAASAAARRPGGRWGVGGEPPGLPEGLGCFSQPFRDHRVGTGEAQ